MGDCLDCEFDVGGPSPLGTALFPGHAALVYIKELARYDEIMPAPCSSLTFPPSHLHLCPGCPISENSCIQYGVVFLSLSHELDFPQPI